MSLILPLFAVLIGMSLVMAAGWFVQWRTGNGGWIDVFWTYGTGAAGVAVALLAGGGGFTARRALVAGLVALWSLRLGTYIALRVARGGARHEDVRYTRLKQEWGRAYQSRMFGFMQIQAPISVVLCLAVLLAATRTGPLGLGDALGALILLGCIAGEGLADQQMAAFRADPAHKGQICDTGLWGVSRHPNYLFEFLGWAAYPAIAFDPSAPWWAPALLAPLVMYALLRFGTGVPPLEQSMLESRGERFRAYQSRVPMFLPFPIARPRSEHG